MRARSRRPAPAGRMPASARAPRGARRRSHRVEVELASWSTLGAGILAARYKPRVEPSDVASPVHLPCDVRDRLRDRLGAEPDGRTGRAAAETEDVADARAAAAPTAAAGIQIGHGSRCDLPA